VCSVQRLRLEHLDVNGVIEVEHPQSEKCGSKAIGLYMMVAVARARDIPLLRAHRPRDYARPHCRLRRLTSGSAYDGGI
jgi:hypothetical protein